MSGADSGSAQWHWRAVRSQSPETAGSSLAAAVVGGQLHVIASLPDGSGASHLRLDGSALSCVGEVPLRSVTGAIGADGGDADALLVCGASASGDTPVVCRVQPDGSSVEVMQLPLAGPVAGWPHLVVTQAPRAAYVVWATGELLAASVWLSEVQRHQVAKPVRLLERVGTLAFRAAGSASAVDVLCYGEALDFGRWQRAQTPLTRRLQTPNDSAATLLGGAVVSPTSSHVFDVWQVDTDEHQRLELPEPPERASAPARHLRLVDVPDEPDVLYWETHLPDDFRQRLDDDSFRMAHGFSVRGWLGRLDRATWRVTATAEIAASSTPPLLAWVDGRLALVGAASGVVEVRLGEPA